jgi:hypothetical protein
MEVAEICISLGAIRWQLSLQISAGGRDQIRDVNRLRGIKFDARLFQRIEAF